MILEVRGVWKSFGKKQVLKGVNLSVMPGESLVVLGGSGSGKSVLLKVILGMLEPDKGSVFLWGKDVARLGGAQRRKMFRKIGMLFQQSALFDSFNVWENIAFGALAAKTITRAQGREFAAKYVQKIGLDKAVLDLSPADLSGGMQKRVALARAVAMQPELIFFDEPTTGLDPLMCRLIDDLILHNVRSLKAASLTITHDMLSAQRVGDRAAVLHEGVILWEGAMANLQSCEEPYVKKFLEARSVDKVL